MDDFKGGDGLFAALKNLVATLLSSGKTRLELLASELEEEKLRAMQMALLALGMVFCLCAGTLVAVLFLTAMFWENRLLVLGVSGGLFLLFGLVFFFRFKRAAHRPEKIFASSIAEFQEDLRQLKSAIGHEPPSE